MAPHDVERERDEVMGTLGWLSLSQPGPGLAFGTSQERSALPAPEASFGFADPDSRLGYAYVMNNMDYYMIDDPREKVLRDLRTARSGGSPVEAERLTGAALEQLRRNSGRRSVRTPRGEPSIDGMCVSEVAPLP